MQTFLRLRRAKGPREERLRGRLRNNVFIRFFVFPFVLFCSGLFFLVLVGSFWFVLVLKCNFPLFLELVSHYCVR